MTPSKISALPWFALPPFVTGCSSPPPVEEGREGPAPGGIDGVRGSTSPMKYRAT